jgi:hypothetical protein
MASNRYVMMVMIEPAPGTETEFLEYYPDHVGDAVQTAGFVRAQRYRRTQWNSPAPWGPVTTARQEGAKPYMTIYEIEGDLAEAMADMERFEKVFQAAVRPGEPPTVDETVNVRIWLYESLGGPLLAEACRKQGLSFERGGQAAQKPDGENLPGM